jgi:hypothetical protein
MRHRAAVFVEHPAAHDDPLAQGLAGRLLGEIAPTSPDVIFRELGTGYLGKSMRQNNQRLSGSALRRRSVAGMKMRGLRSSPRTPVADEMGHRTALLPNSRQPLCIVGRRFEQEADVLEQISIPPDHRFRLFFQAENALKF